jgi:hypothetical protein
MVETDPHLTMFFYGTLKRGHANHDQFCRGYLSAEEARTRGRLYHLPFGYPALVIDEEDIRAVGTADPTSATPPSSGRSALPGHACSTARGSPGSSSPSATPK